MRKQRKGEGDMQGGTDF